MNLKRNWLAAAMLTSILTAAAPECLLASNPAEAVGVFLVLPPSAIEDFALTDQDGRRFSFSSLRGEPALVFFGFTHCPDVCPTTLLKLQQLHHRAPRSLAGLKVVLLSVDGDRDTPAVMKEYVGAFHADFIGLTGTPASVREIAARFPAVFVKGLPAKAGGDYTVQHSPLVYAIDRDGRVYARFSDAAVDDMIATLLAMIAAPEVTTDASR